MQTAAADQAALANGSPESHASLNRRVAFLCLTQRRKGAKGEAGDRKKKILIWKPGNQKKERDFTATIPFRRGQERCK